MHALLKRGALAAGLLLSLSSHAADEAVPLGKLPRTALPQHYALHLRVDPKAEKFDGSVELKLKLTEAANHLWLHGQRLDVRKVEVVDAAGKTHKAKYTQVDADNGVARVDFEASLAAQELTLKFEYTAAFNHQLEGLYKAEHAGKAYIVSQMEAISARLAFPGMDEPSFKAPVDLVLDIPADQRAGANTPQVKREVLKDGWQRLTFATTPPLPTYLVAMTVGPWDITEGPAVPPSALRKDAVPLRGFAPAGAGERMHEALDYTPEIVTALEQYFDRPYAFGKLDLVAVTDFAAGAMENPGLITYRATLLLLDKTTPVSLKQASFTVSAHELAHQWFGDTVTMPWWDDIWLNEAFASWMEGKITQQLRPQYRDDLSSVESAHYAMGADSLASARRIRQPITDQGDIEGAFDGITYSKGAAVLGMFEAWLGPDTFRSGIRAYMRDHAMGNATSDDLIAALAKAGDGGERFSKAMKSFLDQPGVPILSTSLTCKGDKASLAISQQRYFPLGSKGDAKQVWGVPVCVRTGHGDKSATQCQLVDTQTGTADLDGGCPDWYMPNADGRGYYRFAMAAKDLAALDAKAGTLSDAEQLAFADAIDSGFDHGDLDAAAVLSAMQRLSGSPTRQVATTLLGSYGWIREHLADDITRPKLDAWAANLYRKRVEALGYTKREGENEDDTLLRAELVSFLGTTLRDPATRRELLKQADALLKTTADGHLDFAAVNPELMGDVLTALVQDRGAPAIDAIKAELARQTDPQRRSSLSAALGATFDPKLSEAARNFGLKDKSLSLNESQRLLRVNRGVRENRAAFWKWFQANYDAVVEHATQKGAGSLPEAMSGGRCSAAEEKELDAYFAPRIGKLVGGPQSLARARERIGLCTALHDKQGGAALAKWLAQHG